MARVKTDLCNRLNKRHLDVLFWIGEEGPVIHEYDVFDSIDHWFNDRVRRLSSKNHN